MHSSSREEIATVFDALDADLDRVCELSFDALTTPERLRLLEHLEKVARRLPVPGHALINNLVQQATPAELGGKLSHVLADRLRITRSEAGRRVAEAAELGPRQALTGEPLPPRLSANSAGQRSGAIGSGHIAVIRRFFDQLPCWVDVETRACAEQQLAAYAAQFRPETLSKIADRLADYLNPDGNFTDVDRARRRGLTLGKQDIDGMSRLSGWLTPETRATVEAMLAKLAAPGVCNPDDETPTVDGPPSEEAVQRDTRTLAHATTTHSTRPCVRSWRRKVAPAQWVTGVDHRVHHAERPRVSSRQGTHRRGHGAAHVRRHPAGSPRPPLLGHLRQGESSRRCITPNA